MTPTRRTAETVLRGAKARDAFLLRLSDALKALSDPLAIRQVAMGLLGRHLGVNRACYLDVMEDGDTIETGGGYSEGVPSLPTHLKISDFGARIAARHAAGLTVVMANVLNNRAAGDTGRVAYSAIQTRAVIDVPLFQHGRLVAVLAVHQSTARHWTPAEIALVEEVAARTSEAIERAVSEQELRSSEERFRIAANASDMYSWEIDLRTQAVTYSENVVTVTGRHPRNLAEASDSVHPNDRGLSVKAMDQALTSGGLIDYEARALTPGNVYGWYHISGRVLANGSGVPVRAIGIAHNVTAAKRAQLALRENEAQLRFLIESVKDYAIFTIDPEGGVTSWNEGAVRMSGYAAAEMLGHPMSRLYLPADVAAEIPSHTLRRALSQGRSEQEGWRVRQDGERLWVNEIVTPLRAGGGRLLGFTIISRDLTEHKRLEDALRHAHDALERRVAERTAELAQVNVALSLENRERRAGEAQIKALFQRLVSIQEIERRRIAHNLHDHVGQELTALRMNLEALRSLCAELDLEQFDRTLQLAETLDRSIDFVTHDLMPMALEHLGLSSGLASLAATFSERFSLPVRFEHAGPSTQRWNHDVESNLFRIAQEALHNIVKHADATIAVIRLEHGDADVRLTITDDGKGFVGFDNDPKHQRLGLLSMRERALLVGGQLDIDSKPGRGSTVSVAVAVTPEKELGRDDTTQNHAG